MTIIEQSQLRKKVKPNYEYNRRLDRCMLLTRLAKVCVYVISMTMVLKTAPLNPAPTAHQEGGKGLRSARSLLVCFLKPVAVFRWKMGKQENEESE